MKILVFSDSHGDTAGMRRAVKNEHPDHIFHLGDCVRDTESLKPFGIPITQVAGNCDPRGAAPAILTPEFEGVRIYMTHGHLHGVKYQYDRAIYAALAEDAQVLLFGHTHLAECCPEAGLWILNPGACSTRLGSYGILELESGRICCSVRST